VTVEPSSYQMAARRLLLQRLLMLIAALRRYVEQLAGVVSPRQSPRTKARSGRCPGTGRRTPSGGDAADGRVSSSVTTLDQNLLLLVEDEDDGEGAEEGADEDWQSTNVQLKFWDVAIVARLATSMARRRPRATAIAVVAGWRRRHGVFRGGVGELYDTRVIILHDCCCRSTQHIDFWRSSPTTFVCLVHLFQ
jgi:hypothetical protein